MWAEVGNLIHAEFEKISSAKQTIFATHQAPPEVKAEFVEAARKEKEEHARTWASFAPSSKIIPCLTYSAPPRYPNYRYQPAYRRTDIIRVSSDERMQSFGSLTEVSRFSCPAPSAQGSQRGREM